MARAGGGLFLVARNPDGASRLAYLLRVEGVGGEPLLFAAAQPWPRERDVYCHPLDVWPLDPVVIERVPLVSVTRRGRSVTLVLDRPRLRRSMFVWTEDRAGRTLVFWRSPVSMRRPRRLPAMRPARGRSAARPVPEPLAVAVDSRERYAWRLEGYGLTPYRAALYAGDYALVAGERILAAVERKRGQDLLAGLGSGQLALAMAELAVLERALVVVEESLGAFIGRAQGAGPGGRTSLSRLTAVQAGHPDVPIWFCDDRRMAEAAAALWLRAAADALGFRTGAVPPPAAAEDTDAALRTDPAYRRAWAVRAAEDGEVWTARRLAERTGVTARTAAGDLAALVRSGRLVAQGRTRARRYRASGQNMNGSGSP